MHTTFAQRLRIAMEKAGMSQAELAACAGASRSAISQFLSGQSTPGIGRMQALADAVGVSFDYLAGHEEAVEREQDNRFIRKIRIRDAARCLGKSEQFVRIGLQRRLLPFGSAIPGTGGSWSYYISPGRFRSYVGEEQFDAFFGLSDAER